MEEIRNDVERFRVEKMVATVFYEKRSDITGEVLVKSEPIGYVDEAPTVGGRCKNILPLSGTSRILGSIDGQWAVLGYWAEGETPVDWDAELTELRKAASKHGKPKPPL